MRNNFSAVVSLSLAVLASAPAMAATGFHETILPPNDIKISISDNKNAQIDAAAFSRIINEVVNTYKPLMTAQGGRVSVTADWNDDEANASASQMFGSWMLKFTGGLARHKDMTPDGYTLVVCHETGHHMGGYPFVEGGGLFGGVWAADEGQADYFASSVCARKLWASQADLNRSARATVATVAKKACDAAWKTEAEQNLCYRVANAGEALAATLLDLTNQARAKKNLPPLPEVAFETPDSHVVTTTDHDHPAPQCRMDTTLAGSTCVAKWNDSLIPGKKIGANSAPAERESSQYTCMKSSSTTYAAGFRPACWFKELGARRGRL